MYQQVIMCKDTDYSQLVLCWPLPGSVCPLFLLYSWRKSFSLYILPAWKLERMHLNYFEESKELCIFFVIRIRSPSTWVWGVRWGLMLKKLNFVSAVSKKVKFPFLLMVIDILCVHVFLLGSLSDIVFRKSFVLVYQGAFLSGRLERGLTAQPYI